MIKLYFVAVLIYLSQATMFPNRPVAIRCGGDNSCCEGAMYFAHSVGSNIVSAYCQVYSDEDRCVIFDQKGNFVSSRGHYDSRRGC